MIFQILIVIAVVGIMAYVLRVLVLAYLDHQRASCGNSSRPSTNTCLQPTQRGGLGSAEFTAGPGS